MSCGKLFSGTVFRIALPVPTRGVFDYLPPAKNFIDNPHPGIRCLVPFGKRQLVGVLVSVNQGSELAENRLKKVIECLDEEPLIDEVTVKLLLWASDYYHHPLGEVMLMGFPSLLRTKLIASPSEHLIWSVSQSGRAQDPAALQRAPKQAELLAKLQNAAEGLSEQSLNEIEPNWRRAMKALEQKGLVESRAEPVTRLDTVILGNEQTIKVAHLNPEQEAAADTISESSTQFRVFVLQGITGSGKTEVYLEVIDRIIKDGKQALLLVPEINLTPQLTRRFQQRFPGQVAALHSQLTDQQRLYVWLAAKEGELDIIIGTRSAVTGQLPSLGLIIVDEEHDSSLKQQEGFRYSARDLAVMRARLLDIPVVLGSATPSFESLHNVERNRYQELKLSQRYGSAELPKMHLVDMRKQSLLEGISMQLIESMQRQLDNGNQVLLFINRRGFAPTLLCHDCGWVARCKRCDSHMTYHHHRHELRCHHCGASRKVEAECPDCHSSELIPLGEGTQRIEQALQKRFPDIEVLRIDRDSTRRKGSLEKMLDKIHEGGAKILIGTQMLAKGHHFPDVTLVGILNVDQGLFSVDFHAMERMAQLIIQVAGRAGRAEKPGQVLIQTHHPDHPLLQVLLNSGYEAFALQALHERQQACLPPYTYMAILRAEAVDASQPMKFLQKAAAMCHEASSGPHEILGPLPSPMEKRAGRFRAQLILQSAERSVLHALLSKVLPELEKLPLGRKVRWSIDVDPVDVY